MKHGVLLQKFSRLENSTKKLSCCFPTSRNCPFETTHSEWNSLLSHLLQHRQECLRRGKKNPRFFETMTFHSAPKKEQVRIHSLSKAAHSICFQPPFSYFDEDGTAKSRTQNPASDEDHLALFLAALNLRRRDPTKPAKILNNTSHVFKGRAFDLSLLIPMIS